MLLLFEEKGHVCYILFHFKALNTHISRTANTKHIVACLFTSHNEIETASEMLRMKQKPFFHGAMNESIY